jgi:lysophospholipase L1-like esterase
MKLRFWVKGDRHKFISGVLVVGLGLAVLGVATVRAADNAGTWVDGNLPTLQLGAEATGTLAPNCSPNRFTFSTYALPGGGNGTTIREVQQDVCETANLLGQFGATGATDTATSFSFVKPKTNYAYRVLDPQSRERGVVPVPNQSRFLYQEAHSFVAGITSLRFFDSLASAGKFGVHSYGSGVQRQELAYKLYTLPEPLKDSAGNTIYMRGNPTFSNNGAWMIVEAYNLGVLRVDTQTRQMQLISTAKARYTDGLQSTITLGISDDGNSAIKSGTSGDPTVYDLSGCQPLPFTVGANTNVTTGCRGRLVQASLDTQVPGFQQMLTMRFSADGKSIQGKLLRYNSATSRNAVHHFTYTHAGYVVPQTTYLALGDSFSSGEGAYDYEPGTDEESPRNKCHLSRQSYPYLTARALDMTGDDFHNVACSGAKSASYWLDAQYDNTKSNTWLAGEDKQSVYAQRANSDVLTISMIGNDIGFSNKLARCVAPDSCYYYREDRVQIAQEIQGKFDTLVKLYEDIRRDSGEGAVYVLGYPQLFSAEGACSTNALMDLDERQMSRGLVAYLNSVIKAATQKAGVVYIDVENAFSGKELCGVDADRAVNGLTTGDDVWISNLPYVGQKTPEMVDRPLLGNERFHPNALGHQLMSQALLVQSQSFTKPMPAKVSSTTAPGSTSAAYANFLGASPTGGDFERGAYAFVDGSDVVFRNAPLPVDIPEILLPSSQFDFWFNSEPTYVGSLTADETGKLRGEVIVPASLAPGYHVLHIYGHNIAGEAVDMNRTVYVAAAATDYDGDGTPNAEEACVGVEPAGQDVDRDGVDDACDAEITQTPADTVSPTVSGAPSREPNAHGWYAQAVTVNWEVDDPAPSSGAPTRPAQTFAGTEGVHTYHSEPSCDGAGNCATGSLEVRLDTTAPNIDFTLSSPPSSGGWHSGPVTVTFVCDDSVSGVAICSEPITVESGTTIVTGMATDRAGNSAGVNVVVAIDTTKPTVRQAVSPHQNAAGWHNSDVTVTPECSDTLSGVATCDPVVVLDGEGAGQTVESTARDRAGNTTSATASVSIDKTAPVLGVPAWNGNPKAYGQTAGVSVPASDNLSGVTEAEYFLGDTDPGRGNGATMAVHAGSVSVGFGTDFPTGVYKVSVRAKDAAGNWSNVLSDYLVVYNATGVRMTGKKVLLPSLHNGDALPGLITDAQTDTAKFGFNVRYDKDGNIHPHSDFQFSYHTGSKCNKPALAQNCHSFNLNATTIDWLATQSVNDSMGVFQGTAALEIDGVTSDAWFRLTGLDGERLDATSADWVKLQVFRVGENPNTATPMYQVDAEVIRGNIKIRSKI